MFPPTHRAVHKDRSRRLGISHFLLSLCLLVGTVGAEELPSRYQQPILLAAIPILCPLEFGGQQVVFVLNPATKYTVCDPALRDRLGPAIGRFPATGQSPEMRSYAAPPMKIGSRNLPQGPVAMVDLAPLRRAIGHEIRGILGADSLRESVLIFDFDGPSFTMTNRLARVPDHTEQMDLEASDACPAARCRIPIAGEDVKFSLDLGFTDAIALAEPEFSRLAATGAIAEDPVPAGITLTVEGEKKAARSGTFTRGQLMGRNLKGVPVNQLGSNRLGLGMLFNFNFILDFKEAKFYYQLRHAPPPLHVSAMLGAVLVFADGVAIIHTLPAGGGGAVADAGLRVGDRIVRMGDLRRGQFNMSTLFELCVRHAGEKVPVEVLHEGDEKPTLTELKVGEIQFLIPPEISPK